MSQPRKSFRRRVDGVLLLDKPAGISSNAALQKARGLLNAVKAGHTGTLDPMATGLLPLCFGEATKFAGELLNSDKRYIATVQLGIRTETADAEGRILETCPVAATRGLIEMVLARFRGDIRQVPPMYSALKRDGRPLYEYARRGMEVERKPRSVRIYSLELCEFDADRIVLDVVCSKGTYVRTLAEDIGAALGCGGHLSALRRIRIGDLQSDKSVDLDALEAMPLAERDNLLLPVDTLLEGLPRLDLDDEATLRFSHGQAVLARQGEQESRLRVYATGGHFLGLGRRVDLDGRIAPIRLLASNIEN